MTGADPLAALTPTSFRKDNLAEDEAADLAAQVFVLDLQEALPGVQRLRDWALERLAPASGETAVDVGCGTGAEVRRFAERVGADGRAIGVEPHAGLRAIAGERSDGTTAEYLDGDATALPFEDASVHVLRCERVLQHVPDPEAAAREFARVLAPGGRLVVIDSDWGSQVVHPGDPEVVRRLLESSWRRWANPFSGRLLRGQLGRAGLRVDPDIGSTAVLPPIDGILPMLRTNLDLSIQEGAVTPEEGDALLAELGAAAGTGEAFVAVTMFAVAATRPD